MHTAVNAELSYFFYVSHGPGCTVREHAHTYYEMAYYAEGAGTTCIAGRAVAYGAGQYSLYRPGVPHTEEHSAAVTVYCLGFYLPEDAPPLEDGVYTDFGKRIWKRIQDVRREFGAKEIYHDLYVNLYTTEIVLQHYRNQQTRRTKPLIPWGISSPFLTRISARISVWTP